MKQECFEQMSLFDCIDSPERTLREAKQLIKSLEEELNLYFDSLLHEAFSQIPAEAILGDLIFKIDAGKNILCSDNARDKAPDSEAVYIVKTSSVSKGSFLENESKILGSNKNYDPSHIIKPGNFLFLRQNSLKYVGACVIVEGITKKLLLSDKVIRLNIKEDLLLPEFLKYYLRSPQGKRKINKKAKGIKFEMQNIKQDDIKRLAIPLPALSEQAKVVASIDRQICIGEELRCKLDGIKNCLIFNI